MIDLVGIFTKHNKGVAFLTFVSSKQRLCSYTSPVKVVTILCIFEIRNQRLDILKTESRNAFLRAKILVCQRQIPFEESVANNGPLRRVRSASPLRLVMGAWKGDGVKVRVGDCRDKLRVPLYCRLRWWEVLGSENLGHLRVSGRWMLCPCRCSRGTLQQS